MKDQILAFQKANREMKEHLQDAVMLLRQCEQNNWGVDKKQDFARLSNKAFGTAYNEKDWDMKDYNGDQ